MLRVTIQEASREQAGQLGAIRQSVGWPTADVNAIFQSVELGQQIVYIATHADQAVGAIHLAFVHLDPAMADGIDTAYLNSLCVVPVFQRVGVATQLVLYAEMQARRRSYQTITIDVDQKNGIARDLYEQLGYRHFKDTYAVWGLLHCMCKAL